MTPEQRFDRLERIAKLLVRAGMRGRSRMREMDEKINILIDAQIRNEERFARTDEKFAETNEKFEQLLAIIRREREERGGDSVQS